MSSKITTVSQVAKQPSNKPYEGNHFLARKAVCAQRKKNISFKFTMDIQVAKPKSRPLKFWVKIHLRFLSDVL